jgi:hypothetical protein
MLSWLSLATTNNKQTEVPPPHQTYETLLSPKYFNPPSPTWGSLVSKMTSAEKLGLMLLEDVLGTE